VGGAFTSLAGEPRQCLARLHNTDPVTQSLTFDGSTLTWLRGGASPEVWRTTFDYSLNGTDWTSLGEGTRIAGGWQRAGVAFPSGATARARGFVATSGNGAGWFVETRLASPVLWMQAPAFRQGQFGFYILGRPQQEVVVEASLDLQTWTSVWTNTLGAGPLYFSDPESAARPGCFYRVRREP
jgi:hypothetical protein